MTLASVSNTVTLSLSLLFFLVGGAHIIGLSALRATYRHWQFPHNFRYVAGVAQLLAALFLALPQTRLWGDTLAAVILFASIVSLLNHGKYIYAIPAILAMIALVPAVAGPMQ